MPRKPGTYSNVCMQGLQEHPDLATTAVQTLQNLLGVRRVQGVLAVWLLGEHMPPSPVHSKPKGTAAKQKPLMAKYHIGTRAMLKPTGTGIACTVLLPATQVNPATTMQNSPDIAVLPSHTLVAKARARQGCHWFVPLHAPGGAPCRAVLHTCARLYSVLNTKASNQKVYTTSIAANRCLVGTCKWYNQGKQGIYILHRSTGGHIRAHRTVKKGVDGHQNVLNKAYVISKGRTVQI